MRRAPGAGLVIAALVLASALVTTAGLSQSVIADRSTLADAKAREAEARARADRLEAAASNAADEASKARARAQAVAAQVQAAEAGIATAQARIAAVSSLQQELAARLAQEQEPTVRLVAALQMLARRPTAIALVQPGSVDDLIHTRAILAAVAPAIDQRTASLRADLNRARALRTEGANAVAALRNNQAALVTQRNALTALAAARRTQSDTLAGSAMAEQDRALSLAEQARDIGDLLARVDAAANIRQQLETLPGPVMRPALPGAPRPLPAADPAQEEARTHAYRLPVVGQVVTGLGEVSDTGVRARGLTIATQPRALVIAPADGHVVYAGTYRGYGQIVILDHGGGWTTLITNLDALDVRVGDNVDQGDPVGRAGPDHPTVTVELRKGGTAVDIARLVG